jgi:GntR family transcriptional regulator, transcriptional repressor for pyruvate dehydrogenase complex
MGPGFSGWLALRHGRCTLVAVQPRPQAPTLKASLAIAADIRARIAKGELRAGEPLPVERELMDDFGVSKGVAREALRILETEGLIEVRRGLGGGPRVRHPSISEAAMGMGVYLQIGDVLVIDVWEARDRIIAGALERLATRGHEGDVAALDQSVQELTALVGDFDAYYVQLLNVGETAVRLAGNATDHVLVVALRYVISAELEMATRALVDVDAALAVEDRIARSWRDVSRNVRLGRGGAARRLYERQAELLRNDISTFMPGTRVIDVFPEE